MVVCVCWGGKAWTRIMYEKWVTTRKSLGTTDLKRQRAPAVNFLTLLVHFTLSWIEANNTPDFLRLLLLSFLNIPQTTTFYKDVSPLTLHHSSFDHSAL